jgi:exodeoxyribonuclease VII large subunit
MEDITLSVSDFVALVNQTMEYAHPFVTIVGELANFRVSKNRWVYFDLKDDESSVRFFGTVYQLPGPLEDGMLLQVSGSPRLHPLYGFSVNVQSMQPVGEGAIKRAAELLEAKLKAEGLFDPARKRSLPYPPAKIGLVASKESAAYVDFIKVLASRWRGVEIVLADVQVQGEPAPGQIVAAITNLNELAQPPEVIIITRGGGSAEDMAAFSSELVTRAVAASRVPTMVAIGHERDVCLAELAADQRASTPSNAAELLVPDRAHLLRQLTSIRSQLTGELQRSIADYKTGYKQAATDLRRGMLRVIEHEKQNLARQNMVIKILHPNAALQRGYAVIRQANQLVRSVKDVKVGSEVELEMADGRAQASILSVKEANHA